MKIEAVIKIKQRHECQEPLIAYVGVNGVTEIIKRSENCGTYVIEWFDIYVGDTVKQSINSLEVAAVFILNEKPPVKHSLGETDD